MRRLFLKEKVRQKVEIPAEMRESMRAIWELIEEAKRNDEINLDFDDAIQVDSICGGRYGEESRPYVLTYFPPGDTERGRWFLTLHASEIGDIGDGHMTEIVMYRCESPECRFRFREPSAHCSYCDYFEDPTFGTFRFPEAAKILEDRGVFGIKEGSTMPDVVAALGEPNWSGGGFKHPTLGFVHPWIKYQRSDCQIHFEFNKTKNRIQVVTVMEQDWKVFETK